MKRFSRIAICTALAILPPPVSTPVVAQELPARAVSDNAAKLVQLFADKDLLVAKLRSSLPRAFAANLQMQALEVEYPGITDYVVKAILPNAEARTLERAPRMWEAIASFFTANMSEADLGKVVAFYNSQAGKHIIAIMRGADIAPMSAALAKGRGNATGEALQGGAETAARQSGLVDRLTPTEQQEVLVFAQSAAGRKWAAITPAFYTLIAGLSNSEMAKSAPEQTADILAAIKAYQRDHSKKI